MTKKASSRPARKGKTHFQQIRLEVVQKRIARIASTIGTQRPLNLIIEPLTEKREPLSVPPGVIQELEVQSVTREPFRGA
jgi:hypothetical protein